MKTVTLPPRATLERTPAELAAVRPAPQPPKRHPYPGCHRSWEVETSAEVRDAETRLRAKIVKTDPVGGQELIALDISPDKFAAFMAASTAIGSNPDDALARAIDGAMTSTIDRHARGDQPPPARPPSTPGSSAPAPAPVAAPATPAPKKVPDEFSDLPITPSTLAEYLTREHRGYFKCAAVGEKFVTIKLGGFQSNALCAILAAFPGTKAKTLVEHIVECGLDEMLQKGNENLLYWHASESAQNAEEEEPATAE